MNGRVIITYGRSLMALTAAHSLGQRGVEVIGCDDVDMTVMNFSRHVSDYFLHAPYQTDLEKYLDDLEENIRKFKPDDDRPYILMPMFRDAKILAKHRARFDGLITIAAPDYGAINQVDPKDVFAQTCNKYNLKIPKTEHPENISALEAMRDSLEFPLLIKPIDAVGGRGIHKAENFEELATLYKESSEKYEAAPLVQEMIEGRDYCLSTLCDNGEIVAHMAYKNLYQFPRGSGAGIMRETVDDEPFLATAAKLLKALNWHGIAQIDFRWSEKEGEGAYLIEVNPRFWAGLFHSVESGVDFPWLLYQLAAYGAVKDDSHVQIGAKTKIPGLWTISALQDIAESETHFERLKAAWEETWNAESDQNWKDKFIMLTDALKSSVDGKDIVDKIKEMHETGKQGKSEFSAEGDPFTGLGFLFVASSLLRHGELPPELKSE
jgi:predicted ATP-grasp superfamily ATP-dependent carboligase